MAQRTPREELARIDVLDSGVSAFEARLAVPSR
jgi:hypothetical protein